MKIINPYLNSALWSFLSLLFFFPSISLRASPSSLPLPNPRLLHAYIALQAWKHAITSDPNGFTSNWCGPNVCNYTGVYCAPAPDDTHVTTVAGIDLNHAGIAGYLPEELGLLTDLALLHINSNRFCGSLPESFRFLHLLYELDVSNNLFAGKFPNVVLSLPSLKYLDIRFNGFEGDVPSRVFDLKLDALFINNNRFQSSLPANFGNSPVSVVVLANNNWNVCFPPSIKKMGGTLNEIVLRNVGLKGCLPPEIGLLKAVRVLDVSSNMVAGKLPESIGGMQSLEELNVAHNVLSGEIPASIYSLPKLGNFTYSNNYFYGEPGACQKLQEIDDGRNCIPARPGQRPAEECKAFYSHPVDCGTCG
ncbi:leucine-rich repeat extensin-like protein 6 [Diospyros lotus]|uniref:leucine-rich repeat extensin-like protein 6 n=1 Tax=Diospyros lotus TaxID=55363 RepID=UPI00224FD16A|nr:leucine-rich repeat extensin-like protein 6 [Diospyros lotus]